MAFNYKDNSKLQIQTKTANLQRRKPSADNSEERLQKVAAPDHPGEDFALSTRGIGEVSALSNRSFTGAGSNVPADVDVSGLDNAFDSPRGGPILPRFQGPTGIFTPPGALGGSGGRGFGGGDSSSQEEQQTDEEETDSEESVSFPNDDVIDLPASNKDYYLVNKHGLTSLYPVIISSHAINNDFETLTKFIDLNVAMKRAVEIAATTSVNKFTQISDENYTSSMQRCADYLSIMRPAAFSKDKVVFSLSPTAININQSNAALMSQPPPRTPEGQTSTATVAPPPIAFPQLDGSDYVFLGTRSLTTFFREAGITYEFTNTQIFLQILKVLSIYQTTGFLQEGSETEESTLDGYLPKIPDQIVVDTINNLRSATTALTSTTALPLLNLDREITDIQKTIVTVSRDLIAHSRFNNIRSLTSASRQTVVDILQEIIGSYGPTIYTIITTAGSSSNQSEIATVGDFISATAGNTSLAFDTIITSDARGNRFSILDTDDKFSDASETGVDYLIYNELSSELNAVTFDNLSNFSLIYSTFSNKIMRFMQAITARDDERYFFVRTMCVKLAQFMDDARLTDSTPQGKGSGNRMLIFFTASQNNNYAQNLFKFLCIRDEITQGKREEDDSEYETLGDLLVTSLESANTMARSQPNIEGTTDPRLQKSFRVGSRAEIKSAVFNREDTSFSLFHEITRDIESSFSNLEGDLKITTKSIGLSTHSRALIIFQYFMSLLQTMKFVPIKNESIITSYGFFTDQFLDARSALNNIDARTTQTTLNGQFYRTNYVRPLIDITTQIDQNCLDAASMIDRHAGTIKAYADELILRVENAKLYLRQNSLGNKDTLLHSLQAEQCKIKQHLLDMHKKSSSEALYLPASDEYTVGQTKNLKTCIDSDLFGTNQSRTSILTIGLTAGLLENLKYKVRDWVGDFEIIVTFKNLQLPQIAEVVGETTLFERRFMLSVNLHVTEGSLEFSGADTQADSLTNLQNLFRRTSLYRDTGVEVQTGGTPTTYDDAVRIYGSDVVDNTIKSYYAGLLLRSTVGIDVSEQNFPVIEQVQTYPDSNSGNYLILEEDVNNTYTSPESAVFSTRVKRDLARSKYCAPIQHFDNVVTSKTFERIVNIIIDEDNSDLNFSFNTVLVEIRAVGLYEILSMSGGAT